MARAAIDYDSGTIGKTCECKDHECRNSELCACKQCDEAGCPGGKCSPAALMICDMKGNGIEWNELKSIQNISNDETIVRNKVDIYRMARFFIEVHTGSSFFFDEVRFIVGTRGGT